jgi:chemotaxis regulatin CheY-phosphate phosphatase CheZ
MHRDDPLRHLKADGATPENAAELKERQVIGAAVASTLETLLPQAARAVEKASQGISDAFLFISEHAAIQDSITQQVADLLSRELPEKAELQEHLRELVAKSRDSAAHIQKACQETVLAMQFQDRNSQIIENAQNMLEIYRQLILLENRSDRAEDDTTQSIAETMYSFIRLSDMRNVFVQELKKRDIDISQLHVRSFKKNDDTELF